MWLSYIKITATFNCFVTEKHWREENLQGISLGAKTSKLCEDKSQNDWWKWFTGVAGVVSVVVENLDQQELEFNTLKLFEDAYTIVGQRLACATYNFLTI